MALQFPVSPDDGAKWTPENGIEYTYDITNDSWTAAVGGGLSGEFVPLNDWSTISELV
jgi:hypothetical protein